MIGSKGLGVSGRRRGVIGRGRVGVVVSLCQIAAVSARSRCRTRAQTPGWVRAAVAFEVELGFEGLVDRLDDLSEWS